MQSSHGRVPYLGKLFRDAVTCFLEHDMGSYAAALTYHALFSLFPFVLFVTALLGFFELSNLFDWIRRQFQVVFLEQTMQQINLVLDQLQRRRAGMLSFSVLFSMFAASSAMRSLMNALNVVY